MRIGKSNWVWLFIFAVLLVGGSKQAHASSVITITHVHYRDSAHPNQDYVYGVLSSSEGLPTSITFILINFEDPNDVYTVPATIQWMPTGTQAWSWQATLDVQSVPAIAYDTQVVAVFTSGLRATDTYEWSQFPAPECNHWQCD